MLLFKPGYLERGKDTLLVVDWEDLASKPCYLSAKMNTRQVGRCTGEVLSVLKPIREIHIVGFSLGAHVAGHVSSYLTKTHGILIDRITGKLKKYICYKIWIPNAEFINDLVKEKNDELNNSHKSGISNFAMYHRKFII